jgi:hypothetical protein
VLKGEGKNVGSRASGTKCRCRNGHCIMTFELSDHAGWDGDGMDVIDLRGLLAPR